jgi:heme-degrading monooxygenase HmoA
MYRIVWEYDAAPQHLEEFEDVYGPNGRWVEFFRRSPDYISTELFRCTSAPQRFVTLDTWRSRPAYESFRKTYSEQYAELDDWCRRLTAHERMLGMVDDGK